MRFKCGSVCIGVYLHHIVVDGISSFHFINSWFDIARGIPVVNPPFIDRIILDAWVPPTHTYHHIKYDPPPTMINASSQTHDSKPTTVKTFKITPDQLATLKSKIKSGINYSAFEVLTAQIWYCVCKAPELCSDQSTKLYFPINGRFRLDPLLPSGYFGNVQFTTAVISSAGEIDSSSLEQLVEKIHKSLQKMDDGYLKSTLGYFKKQSDLTAVRREGHIFGCPNLDMVSWTGLPLYNADFGWGRPIHMGRAKVRFEGISYITRSPNNDNTLSLIICFQSNHINAFHNLFKSRIGLTPKL
ncbi:shikimate O-hydroxycinnamoyltransferase-like [Euphorbia lathyris]|uniref:shikimate O-hydroxycinnamoyltransferase-like n=1 Tax=Euphorbia lathyris TaxID=212925 RepID=UPI0033137653